MGSSHPASSASTQAHLAVELLLSFSLQQVFVCLSRRHFPLKVGILFPQGHNLQDRTKKTASSVVAWLVFCGFAGRADHAHLLRNNSKRQAVRLQAGAA